MFRKSAISAVAIAGLCAATFAGGSAYAAKPAVTAPDDGIGYYGDSPNTPDLLSQREKAQAKDKLALAVAFVGEVKGSASVTSTFRVAPRDQSPTGSYSDLAAKYEAKWGTPAPFDASPSTGGVSPNRVGAPSYQPPWTMSLQSVPGPTGRTMGSISQHGHGRNTCAPATGYNMMNYLGIDRSRYNTLTTLSIENLSSGTYMRTNYGG